MVCRSLYPGKSRWSLHRVRYEEGTGTPIVAALILLILAAGMVVFLSICFIRSPYNVPQTIVAWINLCLTRILWRVEVEGHIPESNGVGGVLVCNHRGSVDPFFIQLKAGRIVHWFVAKEYFRFPVVGSFLRISESIPTNRAGIDTASTKAAIRMARQGDADPCASSAAARAKRLHEAVCVAAQGLRRPLRVLAPHSACRMRQHLQARDSSRGA